MRFYRMNVDHDWFGFVTFPDDLLSVRSLVDHQVIYHDSNGCSIVEVSIPTVNYRLF